ncbi:hypothetical protein AB5I39_14395 [Sphingomonas sp. MMS24-J45]
MTQIVADCAAAGKRAWTAPTVIDPNVELKTSKPADPYESPTSGPS